MNKLDEWNEELDRVKQLASVAQVNPRTVVVDINNRIYWLENTTSIKGAGYEWEIYLIVRATSELYEVEDTLEDALLTVYEKEMWEIPLQLPKYPDREECLQGAMLTSDEAGFDEEQREAWKQAFLRSEGLQEK